MVLFSTLLHIIIGFGIAFAAKFFFGWEVTGFTLIIIPVGSFILGALMGMGLPNAMIKKHIRKNKQLGLVSLILAIVCAIGIQFMFYEMTYMDESGINYKFQGDHISNYVISASDEPITFMSFTKFVMNESDFNISRRGRSLASIKGNATLNWAVYIIELLGFIVGFRFTYSASLNSAIFCEKCEKYMKEKNIFKLVSDVYDKKKHLTEILSQSHQDEFISFVDDNPSKEKAQGPTYSDGVIHYCEDCSDGFIVLKDYIKNDKNKYQKDSQERKMKLDKELVESYITKEQKTV